MTNAKDIKAQYEQDKRLCKEDGERAYSLGVFGNELAKRQQYKGVQGIEAVLLEAKRCSSDDRARSSILTDARNARLDFTKRSDLVSLHSQLAA